MPGKVPDRWEDYQPCGTPIKGTRFISFKVPLEEGICRRLPSQDLWFTPNDLFDKLKAEGHDIGLVIDLTFTDRYYNYQVFEENGIKHFKLKSKGHEIPNKQVRKKFRKAVDKYLEDNADNGKIVGVHCTHGLNRTGYLICRYMIEKLNFGVDEAINEFNTARGHNIERENYIADLKGLQSGVVEDDTDVASYPDEAQYEYNGYQTGRYPKSNFRGNRRPMDDRYTEPSSYNHPLHTRYRDERGRYKDWGSRSHGRGDRQRGQEEWAGSSGRHQQGPGYHNQGYRMQQNEYRGGGVRRGGGYSQNDHWQSNGHYGGDNRSSHDKYESRHYDQHDQQRYNGESHYGQDYSQDWYYQGNHKSWNGLSSWMQDHR